MTLSRAWPRRKAIIALGLVSVHRGVFTAEQAAQIEAWRAENEANIAAEVARKGERDE